METTLIIILSSFFGTAIVIIAGTLLMARQRSKRTDRLMQEMMDEYEHAYLRCPDDFLRDNIIEFQDHRWRNLDKNNKK
jgi:hypothetical protein